MELSANKYKAPHQAGEWNVPAEEVEKIIALKAELLALKKKSTSIHIKVVLELRKELGKANRKQTRAASKMVESWTKTVYDIPACRCPPHNKWTGTMSLLAQSVTQILVLHERLPIQLSRSQKTHNTGFLSCEVQSATTALLLEHSLI